MKAGTMLAYLLIAGLICGRVVFSDQPGAVSDPGGDGGLSFRQDVPDRVYIKIDFAGEGNGIVRIAPGEVECRKSDQICSVGFRKGTEVVLVAKASGANSAFAGWTGGCVMVEGAGPDACRIKLTENMKVTASFSYHRFRIFSFDFPDLFKKTDSTVPAKP